MCASATTGRIRARLSCSPPRAPCRPTQLSARTNSSRAICPFARRRARRLNDFSFVYSTTLTDFVVLTSFPAPACASPKTAADGIDDNSGSSQFELPLFGPYLAAARRAPEARCISSRNCRLRPTGRSRVGVHSKRPAFALHGITTRPRDARHRMIFESPAARCSARPLLLERALTSVGMIASCAPPAPRARSRAHPATSRGLLPRIAAEQPPSVPTSLGRAPVQLAHQRAKIPSRALARARLCVAPLAAAAPARS